MADKKARKLAETIHQLNTSDEEEAVVESN